MISRGKIPPECSVPGKNPLQFPRIAEISVESPHPEPDLRRKTSNALAWDVSIRKKSWIFVGKPRMGENTRRTSGGFQTIS